MFSTACLPPQTGLSLNDNQDHVLPQGCFYDFNKTTLLCTELLREVCAVPKLAENFVVGGRTAADDVSLTFGTGAMRSHEDCVQCFHCQMNHKLTSP